MPTTREDIQRWIDQGIKEGATDLVVVCDTFDYGDYPVYCKSPQDARDRVKAPGSMQKIMEVYDLTGDTESQLQLRRCYQFSDDVVIHDD